MPSRQKVKHGFADGDAHLDLFRDDGLFAIGNGAFDLDSPVHKSSGGSVQTLFVSVLAGKSTASDATAAATAAAQAGRAKLLAASTAWWADYWPQSFVTLPVTRAEGFYYTEMYRFVSSDRVGLHGLMGAFGPTVRARRSLSGVPVLACALQRP